MIWIVARVAVVEVAVVAAGAVAVVMANKAAAERVAVVMANKAAAVHVEGAVAPRGRVVIQVILRQAQASRRRYVPMS